MTLHIFYDHSCSNCGANYIPYDKDVPCPKCGIVENEHYDFIPRAVASLKFNLKAYGLFSPLAWWISSFADSIMLVIFNIFENYREKENKDDFSKHTKEMLEEGDWKDKEYLKNHIYDIALRIYQEIKDEIK